MAVRTWSSLAVMMCLCVVGGGIVAAAAGGEPTERALPRGERPNILWISCEDISPLLGCYGVASADTPNLDRLAAEGVLFSHAFSCHGVCAPSRTGIITGISPISLGANHMRSKVRLPESIRLFPELLRQAGYYCTNNSKTDYNLEWNQRRVWDENSAKAHWKNRPRPEQPFFAVFNLTMTHESKVWPAGWRDVVGDLPVARRHDPAEVLVPPIYPDTPAVRGDLARLADLIAVMDQAAGRLLRELDESGESERTVVMFWSDHGSGLPRAKRWTYDSGARVPLIVRLPKSLQGLPGAMAPGSRDERMVSLLDLAPTVLGLAGVAVPAEMQGRAFLGANAHAGHSYVFGARDRLDERQDLVRTVRSRRYRYVRNLMPWLPALQHVEYGERNETLKEMRRLDSEGELAEKVGQWLRPRMAEELYDLERDPWETENRIADTELAGVAKELREACDRWQLEMADTHLLPEPLLEEESLEGDRYGLFRGVGGSARLARLLAAARGMAAGNEAPGAVPESDPGVLCWKYLRAARSSNPGAHLAEFSAGILHASPSVRLFAAAGLARAGGVAEAAAVFRELLRLERPALRQGVMRELDEAGGDIFEELRGELGEFAVGDEYFRRLYEHATAVEGG
jgi:uncharacterized sulfatase